MTFTDLLQSITQTHTELQARAAQSVNQSLTIRNWCIGAYIVEYEQNGQDRAKYGDKMLPNLVKHLKEAHIKGLTIAMLKRCRQFYQTYPLIYEVLKDAVPQFRLRSSSIGASVMDQFQNPENQLDIAYNRLLLERISFTHFIELVKIENPKERRYYEMLTIKSRHLFTEAGLPGFFRLPVLSALR